MSLPEIVDEREWKRAQAELLEKEKAATRQRDALAADRRRLPMMEFSTDSTFEGPEGEVGLLDLFEGRRQLLVYNFWFGEDGEPCGGCSMFTDQISPLAHLHARDTSFALVSRASQGRIQAFARRMGWEIPGTRSAARTSSASSGRRSILPLTCSSAIAIASSSPTRPGSRRRGARQRLDVPRPDPVRPPGELGGHPAGRPQGPPYAWWRLHDSYEPESEAAA